MKNNKNKTLKLFEVEATKASVPIEPHFQNHSI